MHRANAAELLQGRYRVEGTLGEGGMGTVLRARHVDLDQPVAIKLMRSDVSAVWAERFLREARAASRIDSEHVARVFDMSRLDDGTPYMVMELLEGRDLGAVLDEDGPLPIEDAIDFARQACRALEAAHELGIIHRDVKPDNLFLAERTDGTVVVKLLDFGVSKEADRQTPSRLTGTQSVLGSPQFMSPEQLVSPRDVDHRTDLWSLGATLFELLTGEHAFPADTIAELHSKILRDPPRRLAEVLPSAPPELDAIIARCLAKRPEDRFASASTLEAALARVNEEDAFVQRDTLPALFAAPESSAFGLEDETPAATVRPVVHEAAPPSVAPRASGWTAPLGVVLGLAGILFGIASQEASPPPAQSIAPALAALVPPPPPAPPPSPEIALPPPEPDAGSRFMDSVPIPEEVRADLEQRLATAGSSLQAGDLEAATRSAREVLDALAARGIRPHEAVSSVGAQAALVLGHVEAAKLRAELAVPMKDRRRGEERLPGIERQMGLVRAAYGRVRSWNVQSFHRCALVGAAEAALSVAQGFSAAAAQIEGPDATWFAKTAAERMRNARREFRRALGMRTETMLCVEEARAGHRTADEAIRSLSLR